jgi:hypothetical protein
VHFRIVSVAVATIVIGVASFAVPACAQQALPSIDVPVLAAAPSLGGVIDATWAGAKSVTLDGDFTNRRPAEEATTVLVAQDAGGIDLAYTATQREGITAATQTNGAGVLSDDYAAVVFAPNGSQGFQYVFYANPLGTRYQTSSENSAYTPSWQAVGKRTAAGYVVTMRIPLNIIRSGGATSWRVQLERETIATNAFAVWSYSSSASSANDPSFLGTFTNVAATGASTRPRPRAQIYGLGELTPPAYGGDTSRLGADLSIPVTPKASLVATFHPDFSNVEVDQQTIAPTAFARQYTEVRPFFTQVASPFNYAESCINCAQTLYTPAIPTFRDGYALEGSQGPVTFSAFDAVGYSRADSAETADYSVANTNRQYQVDVQRVAVDGVGGLHDDTTSINGGYVNQHSHELIFANYATEAGSAVTDRSQATNLQTGFGYANATTTALAFYDRTGTQFAPADGYVAQDDIIGPGLYLQKTVPFAPKKLLHDISFSAFIDSLHDHLGEPSQHTENEQINFDFRDLLTLHVYGAEQTVRTYDDRFLPFDGNGAYVGYKTQTTTPTYVQYTGGDYYHGVLDAWVYLTTLPVTKRIHLTLETDEDNYLSRVPSEGRAVTWLERTSLDYQISREMQFDLGARQIFGENIPNAIAAPDFTPFRAANVTFAFHYLSRDGTNEFYAVYGDPNSLATKPALFLKLIRYIGAPKGT